MNGNSTHKTRRVLLCGGHLDGQWVDVHEGEWTYRAPKPLRISMATEASDVNIPTPEFATYRLEPMPIRIRSAGSDLWVGLPVDLYGQDRDEVMIKALFQRDVAQQVLERP